jgi:hypothetical protein
MRSLGLNPIGIIVYFGGGRSSIAATGGGARSAPFQMLVSLKRRVLAAHGRTRAAKTTSCFYKVSQQARSYDVLKNIKDFVSLKN